MNMNNYFQKTFSNNIKKNLIKKFKLLKSNLLSDQKKISNLRNFEIQCNEFSKTQLDSRIKNNLNEKRFFSSTEWSKNILKNSNVLEIGSGAGRYTEILKKFFKAVVTVEPTDAIFNNYYNNKSDNTLFLQCNIYDIPFKNGTFDFIFCYGVLQHLKNPEKGYFKIVDLCKKNGRISVDHYRKYFYPYSFYHPKYIWRPIKTRINPKLLLKIIRFYIPIYINIDTTIKKLKYGNIIAGLIPIPCWNYLNYGLDKSQRIEWAILDTFDALGSKYDYPWSLNKLNKFVKNLNLSNFSCKYGANGLILNALK